MRVNTRYLNSTRATSSSIFSDWLNIDWDWVYWGCTCGGVYVPCVHACQVRVTVGDSGLCCCTCVTYFKRWLTVNFGSLEEGARKWCSECSITAVNHITTLCQVSGISDTKKLIQNAWIKKEKRSVKWAKSQTLKNKLTWDVSPKSKYHRYIQYSHENCEFLMLWMHYLN